MSVIAYQESFREMGERIYLRSPESQCSPAQSWEMVVAYLFNSFIWLFTSLERKVNIEFSYAGSLLSMKWWQWKPRRTERIKVDSVWVECVSQTFVFNQVGKKYGLTCRGMHSDLSIFLISEISFHWLTIIFCKFPQLSEFQLQFWVYNLSIFGVYFSQKF
jgi:hypothetical protein